MAKNIALNLGVVALLTLAATGCGRTAMTGAPVAAQAASSNTAVVQGVTRKFGYDYAKFENVLAKKAHPQHLVRQGILRSQVDNRLNCSPVADQGHLGSCTAFAMGRGLREQIAIKNGEDKSTLSGLFLYYVERDAQGDTQNDTGATIDGG
ncbi:MAG: cysteine protease, partial [Cyanobacteria bacterium RYN_339]|nr:cysteine protease [Cyanobacteria bacterium RYN_339]